MLLLLLCKALLLRTSISIEYIDEEIAMETGTCIKKYIKLKNYMYVVCCRIL